MDRAHFVCPLCRATVVAPSSLAGESAPCPKCGEDVDRWPEPIPGPGDPYAVPAGSSSPFIFNRRPVPQWPIFVTILAALVAIGSVIYMHEESGPCILVLAIPIAGSIWWFIALACLAKMRPPVLADYQDVLELLKANPHNGDLRQLALAIGRQYAKLTVDATGNLTYTEAAIQNDIMAACGGQ